jgi:magnesium-transporting ATPase (P-type)
MIFIGSTKTAKELTVDRPRSSLFSVTNISQLIIIFGVQFAGQITAFMVYQKENADYYETYGGM